MTVASIERRVSDEETPLLRTNDPNAPKKPKPETLLPWRQFTIVLFLQLAEPLTSQVIYPFLPELIRDIGVTNGDDTKIGYYVGMMQSIFFATQACTVLHWSRASDRIGRKPVILIGLFGISLSMYCFGFSRTFWGLVVSRSLNGALNGNIGVIKSVMAEMTDSTNIARAYAYQPIAWSTGSTLGPLIGGSLSRPVERFPSVFAGSEFFTRYPYFLPCAIPATFSIIAWIVTYFYLEETNPSEFTILGFKLSSGIDTKKASEATSIKQLTPSPPLPPVDTSLSAVMTPRVLVAAGNYALLSLVDIAYRAIQPLFFATPIALGGLGLDPPTIGICLSILGLANGIFQVMFFADTMKKVGSKNFYLIGIATAFPIFGLFPVLSILAKSYGIGWIVWSVVAVQLGLTVVLNVCYGCVFIYITAAAPSRRLLGATNGLSQMSVSIMRAIGPALANSLFSLSLQHGYLGGWLVYYVMLIITAIAVAGGTMLPREVWKRGDEE